MDDRENLTGACGVPDRCSREISVWMIVIDNAPTLVMFALGTFIVGRLSPFLSFAYLIYCGASIVLFWGLICACCHHYASKACPCGYGLIAPRFFKARPNRDFRKVFKRNIIVMVPCWMVPTAAGIYLLWNQYSGPLLALFGGFCIVGYVLIPAIAKWVGCKGCEIKDRCPWMS